MTTIRKRRQRKDAAYKTPERPKRTPLVDARECLALVSELWETSRFGSSRSGKDLMRSIATVLRKGDDLRGDELLPRVSRLLARAPVEERKDIAELFIYPVLLVHVYCAQAKRAHRAGREIEAWACIADAWRWSGLITAEGYLELNRSLIEKEFATKGALARHARNRKMREEVLEEYRRRRLEFRSMDRAAEELSKDDNKPAFRTVRKWIAEDEKRMRAAGKG